MSLTQTWFPGHMKVALEQIKQQMKVIDVGLIICDARIVETSLHPDLLSLFNNKPIIVLLNKTDLADNNVTKEWINYLARKGIIAKPIIAHNKASFQFLPKTVKFVLKDKIQRAEARGLILNSFKLGIIGIPNSGKSSFINSVIGNKKHMTKNMPGVTRNVSWSRMDGGMLLLDTPGLLWPKLNETQALHLALTGTIPERLNDKVMLAIELIKFLKTNYPNYLPANYQITPSEDNHEVLNQLGLKLGCIQKGGMVNLEMTSVKFLKHLENPKYGKISFERPRSK